MRYGHKSKGLKVFSSFMGCSRSASCVLHGCSVLLQSAALGTHSRVSRMGIAGLSGVVSAFGKALLITNQNASIPSTFQFFFVPA